MVEVLKAFTNLMTSLAGLSIGLTIFILVTYTRLFFTKSNGERLMPLHVIMIGISYTIFAVVVMVRINEVPTYEKLGQFWVYPTITFAFLLGNIALIFILLFLNKRAKQ